MTPGSGHSPGRLALRIASAELGEDACEAMLVQLRNGEDVESMVPILTTQLDAHPVQLRAFLLSLGKALAKP